MPLEPYLAQVQLTAQYSCWGEDEAAVHLALTLEGPAAHILLDLAPVDRTSFEVLITALERRWLLSGNLLPTPSPLQGRCTLVGCLVHARGLYDDCELDGQACQALVDTGSNITLISPGVLQGNKGVLSAAWTPTTVQMRTVTG